MWRRILMWLGLAVLVFGLTVAVRLHRVGFSARASPSSFETSLMRAARRWGTPPSARIRQNPVALTDDVLQEAMAHWADHCATCHDNDGGGRTPIGRSLYPPSPDLRAVATQHLTDGELFYVIERGVPFTGMPAWSTGTAEGERASWALVWFIRHLPRLSDREIEGMETLNPRSAADVENEKRIQEFLKGGDLPKGRSGK